MNLEPQRRSPYQGLIPYTEADAPFFFGREKETRLIIANLFASPLTLLYGASGVGKSSVLRAGVVHQSRQRDDVLVVVFNTWQGDALNDLKIKIVQAATEAKLKIIPPSGSAPLANYLADCSTQLNRRLMIILDQFEEYFLYHPQDDAFAEEFPKALQQAEVPLSFVISLREDFYAKLDRFEGRVPALYENNLRIEHLDHTAARIAVESPLAKFNELYRAPEQRVVIEQGLVDEILKQVEEGKVVLGWTGRGTVKPLATEEGKEGLIETPYLQLVLTRLWNEEMRAHSNVLRLATFQKLGGARKIIQTHLDEVMRQLARRQRRTASRCFKHLVTPSGTKIAMTATDLADYAHLSRRKIKKIDTLLKRLSAPDIRLLRSVEGTGRDSEMKYEIFHDALAPGVLEWLARYRRGQQRKNIVIIVLILLSLMTMPLTVFFLGRSPDDSLVDSLGPILFIYFSLLILVSIPGALGFFVGFRWARSR